MAKLTKEVMIKNFQKELRKLKRLRDEMEDEMFHLDNAISQTDDDIDSIKNKIQKLKNK